MRKEQIYHLKLKPFDHSSACLLWNAKGSDFLNSLQSLGLSLCAVHFQTTGSDNNFKERSVSL